MAVGLAGPRAARLRLLLPLLLLAGAHVEAALAAADRPCIGTHYFGVPRRLRLLGLPGPDAPARALASPASGSTRQTRRSTQARGWADFLKLSLSPPPSPPPSPSPPSPQPSPAPPSQPPPPALPAPAPRRARRPVDRGTTSTPLGPPDTPTAPSQPPSPAPSPLPPRPSPRPPRPPTPPSPPRVPPPPPARPVPRVLAAVAAPPIATPASAPASLDGGACTDAANTLAFMNLYRTRHQAPALTWNSQLAADAQEYAEELAEGGCDADLVHSGVSGELIWWTTGPPPLECRYGVVDWYSEVMLYDFTSTPYTDNVVNSPGSVVAHFTQLVWKSTSSVGCGIAAASGGFYSPCMFQVCRFSPPGNQRGDAAHLANVLPRKAE